MDTKTAKSVLMVLAGVALSWGGFAAMMSELGSPGLPLRTLLLVGAMAAVVVGVWLCWAGLASHVRPPELAGRAVDLLGLGLLVGLAIAAGILSVTDFGIS